MGAPFLRTMDLALLSSTCMAANVGITMALEILFIIPAGLLNGAMVQMQFPNPQAATDDASSTPDEVGVDDDNEENPFADLV